MHVTPRPLLATQLLPEAATGSEAESAEGYRGCSCRAVGHHVHAGYPLPKPARTRLAPPPHPNPHPLSDRRECGAGP